MRVLVTGASGQLGAYVLDALLARGRHVTAWCGSAACERSGVSLRPVDLTDPAAIEDALETDRPDAVVHLAAISSAAGVLHDPGRARSVNVLATALIAKWCSAHDARLVFTSTDLVFDGAKPWNREDDPAEPILAYGRTKREAEDLVASAPLGLVVRIPLLFGPSRSGRSGFFDRTIAGLRRGEPQTAFEDEYRSPLDFGSAATILVRLLQSQAAGIVHIAGTERVSRFDLIRRVASAMGLDPALVLANRRSDVAGPEPRPADVSLDTVKLSALVSDLERPAIEEAAASWSQED